MTTSTITKASKGLNKTIINNAKPGAKPYKLSDLDRLFVLVSVAGSKTWYWNYRWPIPGTDKFKDCSFNIGAWPEVGIADARAARADAFKMLEHGINPNDDKKKKKEQTDKELATTFGGVAAEWIEANSPDANDPNPKQPGKWSKYYAQQVRNFMTRYVIDAPIGQRPIKTIESADIFALVQGVANRKTTTGDERKAKGAPSVAVLIKQWSSAVFELAVATQRANGNPAAGFKVSTAVKKPKTQNNKALSENELKALLLAVEKYHVRKPGQKFGGQRDTGIAIELLLMTMVRTVELRMAQWPEFDFMNATWTIPSERMKMGLPHVVPLPTQAIVLLQELRLINPPPKTDPQWLFPNRRKGSVSCMSATTINRALENMGYSDKGAFRAHGARGTASTYLHGADFEPLIVESALAHKQKGVAGVYNQGKYLKQRREMMQTYANYLESLKNSQTVEDAAVA